MIHRDDLFDRLRDADPARSDDVALIRLAERVLVAPRRRRQPRGLVVAAVAIVACIVAVVAVSSVTSTPQATAAEILRDTSVVAASLPRPAAERYVYLRIVSLELTAQSSPDGPWSASQRIEQEAWYAPDGAGRIVADYGPVSFLGPRDEDRWRAAGKPVLPSGPSDHRFPPGTFPFDDLAALPLSPPALYQRLREAAEEADGPVDVGVLERAAELLARGDATPELRASLYHVIAGLKGIRLVGDYVDPLGREGTAVSLRFDSRGTAMRSVMVFSTGTSTILAEETELLEPAPWIDAAVGDVIRSVAYVEYGVVPTDDERPFSAV